MTDLIQIKDDYSLARDLTSKAIINTNKALLDEAKQSKQKRLSVSTRLENLENKLELILNILTEQNGRHSDSSKN